MAAVGGQSTTEVSRTTGNTFFLRSLRSNWKCRIPKRIPKKKFIFESETGGNVQSAGIYHKINSDKMSTMTT